ncbi:ring-cleaving dioxygenase [Paenibacillus validus]|uniref:ring-cleaving dioxygenase n=1 Tax=Paenibacillus TaxID=44249 RepID=UPI000FD95CC3|nr:ring-cleaving dioxygenase [Paenibacillus validus]MED4601219.1 ring-cleaving dioxygenase [Paenibacillus validus]MED4606898.1 ring-cleaving dioxygenase [Paenibacillus validus]
MTNFITGIHHVTAGVAGAQEDVDFFTQIVGQRMVKQTILFDGADSIYHLYYANRNAEIGTVMTTFPYKQAGVLARRGSGQVKITSYTAPESSLEFWQKHFDKHGVKHGAIETRFGQKRVHFVHPSGLEFEIVGDDNDTREGWITDEISESEAVRGFHSVTMSVREVPEQERFLTEGLGFKKTGEEGPYHRFEIGEGGAKNTVFLLHEPDVPQGSWILGQGTVHHVAFAVQNDEEATKLKLHLEGLGYTDASEVKDRNYFHSVYVRSPGGILCEIATSDIGFATDEPLDGLGRSLLLPPWFEHRRQEVLATLEPITNPQAV